MTDPTLPPEHPADPETPRGQVSSSGDGILLPDAKPKSGKRVAAIAAGAVVIVALAGATAWGFAKLSGGGPGAAAVVPADALVYAAVDLDPSASQKIEAFKTLRKFPDLDKELGDRSEDLREAVVDGLVEGGECDLDFDSDVKPWIGKKIGIAALPGADEPEALFALAVTDEEKARKGIEKIFDECGSEDEFGLAFLDGFALVAQSEDAAKAAAADAQKAALADDDTYESTLDELGDVGIASFYVSPAIKDYVAKWSGADAAVTDAWKSFDGLAATLRFSGGSIELAGVSEGLSQVVTDTTLKWGELPETTVAALGFSLQSGWGDQAVTALEASLGDVDDYLGQAEDFTGLSLPADLEAFFGKGVMVALDEGSDFGAFSEFEDPAALKVGLVLDSKLADVQRVYDALDEALGLGGAVTVGGSDGKVTLTFDSDYADELAAKGTLGSSEAFTDAVPEPDKSSSGFYFDFDGSNGWLEELVGGDEETAANLKPLSSFGASGWRDGDLDRFSAKLQTD